MKQPTRWRAWAVGAVFYGDHPPDTFRSRKDAERAAWHASARGEIPTPIFRVEMRVTGRARPTYYPRAPRPKRPAAGRPAGAG